MSAQESVTRLSPSAVAGPAPRFADGYSTPQPLLSVVLPVDAPLTQRGLLAGLLEERFWIQVVIVLNGGGRIEGNWPNHSWGHRPIVVELERASASRARRMGFLASSGKYVWIIDNDDHINGGLLAHLREHLQGQAPPEIVFLPRGEGFKCSDNADSDGFPRAFWPHNYWLLKQVGSTLWNKVWHRSLMGYTKLLFPEIPRSNDLTLAFWVSITARSRRFCGESVYSYLGPRSSPSRRSKLFWDICAFSHLVGALAMAARFNQLPAVFVRFIVMQSNFWSRK